MFKFILVVTLTNGSGALTAEPMAAFKTQQMCEAVAFIANTGFQKQGGQHRATCIYAMKFGDI
jgi:hypothetical protein